MGLKRLLCSCGRSNAIRRIVLAAGVLSGLAGMAIGPSSAAEGIFCGDRMQGGKATAVTKAEAEAAAISWWSSRAGALGRGYEAWENAKDPQIDCRDEPNGKVTCQATARPCLPEGQTPEGIPKIDS